MNSNIENLFNKYLERSGYRPADLARKLNIHRSTIAKWIDGTNKPSIEELYRLSRPDIFNLNNAEQVEFFEAAGREEYVSLALSKVQPSLAEQEISPKISSSHYTIPLQRPSRVQYFTGREKEIEQILKDIQPGRVVTLVGPGGIGKSAIAAEVVWHLAPGDKPSERFPDGIVFYCFSGNEIQNKADSALEHIVRSWGENPEPTANAAVKRILESRRVLIVLDGTENTDRLDEVLCACAECGVLVTSRRREDSVDHSHRYVITTLPLINSVELFQRWGGLSLNNKEVIEEICELLDGMPLAIRLAGRHIESHQVDVNEYLIWLKEALLTVLHQEEYQHKSIPLLLEHSIAIMSEAARHALAVAGLLSQAPFSSDVIAATLQTSAHKVVLILGELINYSLLKKTEESYQVTHALIYKYARERMVAPEAAVVRAGIFYTAFIHEQWALNSAGRKKIADEQPHIMAILVELHKQKNWQKVLNLGKVIEKYGLSKNLSDINTVFLACLAAVQAFSNKEEEFEYLDKLIITNHAHEAIPQALSYFHRAFTLACETSDRTKEATLLSRIQDPPESMDNVLPAVIKYYQQTLPVYQEIGYKRSESMALDNIGLAYQKLGEPETAIRYFLQALAIYQKISDNKQMVMTLNSLGQCYHFLYRYTEAIETYQIAIKLSSNAAYLYSNLADVYLELGRLDEAAFGYLRHIDLSPNDAVSAAVNLGILARLQGQDATAQLLFEQAKCTFGLAMHYKTSSPFKLWSSLALIYLQLDQEKLAIDALYRALSNHVLDEIVQLVHYDILKEIPNPPSCLDKLYSLLERADKLRRSKKLETTTQKIHN